MAGHRPVAETAAQPSDVLGHADELDRGLRLPAAIALVVGGTIGTSIFIIPSEVARNAGSPAWALAAWVLAGLMAAISALCLAETAAAIPATGGPYAFLKRSYPGELLPFSYAWMTCFAYGPGAMAVVAIMSGGFVAPYLQSWLHLPSAPIHAVAVALLAAVAIVNIVGVRLGGWVQTLLTVGKCALMAFMIAVALIFLSPDLSRVAAAPAVSSQGPTAEGFTSALLLCFFCFSGAHLLTLVGGEIRRPGRAIPLAIFVGVAIVTALYIVLNLSIFAVTPFDQLTGSKRIAFDVMERGLGPVGGLIAAVTVFTSGAGVLNAQCLGYPRILFMLADDGLFFRGPALVHPKTHTPAVAIAVLTVLAAGYLFTGTYADILGYGAFVSQLFVTLVVASVFVLRIREPDLVRPYRVWGYPWTPLVFVLAMAAYLLSLLITKTTTVLVGIVIVTAGVPVYFLFKHRRAALLANELPKDSIS